MPSVELPEPDDDTDRRLIADVKRVGWHVVGVAGDEQEDSPDYAFSVGFFHTLDHPEIAIYGLPFDSSVDLINEIGNQIRSGSRFAHGDVCDDIASGCALAFIDFSTQHYHPELGYARWLCVYQRTIFHLFYCCHRCWSIGSLNFTTVRKARVFILVDDSSRLRCSV